MEVKMKAEEVQVGDWFCWSVNGEDFTTRLRRTDFSRNGVIEGLKPIEITGDILKGGGWIFRGGVWVLKASARLGWNPSTKELIVGYGMFPAKIKFVHELQHIMRLCGIDEDFSPVLEDTGATNAFARMRGMDVGESVYFPLSKWNACRTTASVLKRRFGAHFSVYKDGFSIVVKRID